MKYTIETTIDLPLDTVIALFDNQENMKHWQPELQSFEHLSGDPGQVGAKSRLLYKMGKREVEMIETITVRNLPDEFSGTYEANGVLNIQKNIFKEENGKTHWISECEFRMSGFMKIMGWFMPGAFKKQSRKYMDQFKAFAENHEEVLKA